MNQIVIVALRDGGLVTQICEVRFDGGVRSVRIPGYEAEVCPLGCEKACEACADVERSDVPTNLSRRAS